MRFLFLFFDGLGLGPDDPASNPFAQVEMPYLQQLLGNRRLLLESFNHNTQGNRFLESQRATLLALDASLGVDGLPQSATGQAVLLTGRNIPAKLGYHYGPKPNPAIAEHLRNGNLFAALQQLGLRVALLNAYPPSYFEAIESGRRIYSAIPMAVTSAGISLKTAEDLFTGEALSADITGQGWRDRLGLPNTPLLSPYQAGQRLVHLAAQYDFSLFEFWLTDYIGHYQDMQAARGLLTTIDQMLAGLLQAWDDQAGLVLLTSDHGNLENLSTRRHTPNLVPALVVGAPHLRHAFCASLTDLTGIAPAIYKLFSGARS